MFLCLVYFYYMCMYFSFQPEEQSEIQSSLLKLQENVEQIRVTQEVQQQKLQEMVGKSNISQEEQQPILEEHRRAKEERQKLQESVDTMRASLHDLHRMVSQLGEDVGRLGHRTS
jgi:hypothetical protein